MHTCCNLKYLAAIYAPLSCCNLRTFLGWKACTGWGCPSVLAVIKWTARWLYHQEKVLQILHIYLCQRVNAVKYRGEGAHKLVLLLFSPLCSFANQFARCLSGLLLCSLFISSWHFKFDGSLCASLFPLFNRGRNVQFVSLPSRYRKILISLINIPIRQHINVA